MIHIHSNYWKGCEIIIEHYEPQAQDFQIIDLNVKYNERNTLSNNGASKIGASENWNNVGLLGIK